MITLSQIIITILIIGMYLIITFGLTSSCPKQKVVYRKVVMHPLDIQFSEQNKPSNVYKDMFSKSNVYIGGYTLDNGRTVIKEKN